MRATSLLHRGLITGIGERLVLAREAHGETQEKLAAALEVDRATVSSMEIERTIVGLPALVRIAQRYRLNVHWLATGRGAIFDATEGVHYLGDEGTAGPCRAAVQLLQAYPEPLSFCLVMYQPYAICYGWIFCVDQGRAIAILPGEEKPGPAMRALADFLAGGHRCRGEIRATNDEYEKVCERKANLDDVAKILRRKPNRIEFPEFEDWNLVPPNQRAVVERALRDLKDHWARPSSASDMIQEINTLLKRHSHLVEPMLYSLRTHVAKSLKKASKGAQAS